MRRRKIKPQKKKQVWLITFADMTTLLLTFFVLIFSMSSMDSHLISRINLVSGAALVNLPQGGWEPYHRINSLDKILKNRGRTEYNLEEIKNLLIPEDNWPLEVPPGSVSDFLELEERDEGIVIILSQDIIFEPGSYLLKEEAKALLGVLNSVVSNLSMDINVCGFAEPKEKDLLKNLSSGDNKEIDALDLAALRAGVVLNLLLEKSKKPEKFSLSAYADETSAKRFEKGLSRRVEILVKVQKRLADYA